MVALYEAFTDRRAVTVDDLERAVTDMIPLAVTQAEDVQAIRDWAATRAVRATGGEDLDAAEAGERREPAGRALSTGRGGRTVDF